MKNADIKALEAKLGRLFSVDDPVKGKVLVLTSKWVEALKAKGFKGKEPDGQSPGEFTDEKGQTWNYVVSNDVPSELRKHEPDIVFPSKSPFGMNRAQRRADKAITRVKSRSRS